jgi:predicted O-linked N-acetylglucosamine transferase (SPINDLY family)
VSEQAFGEWIARGRAHQQEGRPADAIPCFRRAARELPGSPVPSFHLGEAYWQLGLADDAVSAWRASAASADAFLPPRLALAEVAMTRGDFASALHIARDVVAIAPDDARSRATMLAARAAMREPHALREAATLFAADPALAHAPTLAHALAAALDVSDDDFGAGALCDALAPHVATLPAVLAAAMAERSVALPEAIAQRRWTIDDLDALRRMAVAASVRQSDIAVGLAHAYHALAGTLPTPPVPIMWPRRTGGRALRLAWLLPAVGSPAWPAAASLLHAVLAALAARDVSLALLCTDDVERSRAALALGPRAGTLFVGIGPRPDAATARILAARDCDVLVDAAGLSAATAPFLRARPARVAWAANAGVPTHREPLVARTFAAAGELAHALADACRECASTSDAAPGADALAERWDAAVREHQQGDLAAAAAGYGEVLAAQPGYAPALHLAGEVALAQGDRERAASAFDAALAAAPDYVEARLSAADLALGAGNPAQSIALVEQGLARSPQEVALWRMLGAARLRNGDAPGAVAAQGQLLLLVPADADAHFNHGVALQRQGDVQGAARAYQRALTLAPDLIAADFNLGVLFQQQGNAKAAIAAYSHVLKTDPRHVGAYKNLGEVLFAAGEIDAWLANFDAFEKHCPKALALAVYALEACQHAADFDRLERYLDGLRRDEYEARDEREMVDCLEELLYLLLFYDVEPALMLRLAQAYDAAAPKVYGAPLPSPAVRAPGPLRVGYLSADLRNHVMGKMMWQVIAHHDRAHVECFFYSNSSVRDEWTERFVRAGRRYAVIAGLDDEAAARLIAEDDLDILVDLSTHTRGARPAILARKPARVQITHVASAGTVGLSTIDFKLTDRFADVPASQEFQIERLLAMEGCVYPFRHVAPAAPHPFHRQALGIPADAVVIGAFVNPLKLSRRCLRLWRDVLQRIPRACLAFSPANPALRASYLRLASAAGIAHERLLFLPQGRTDEENQARYALVDFVLDTLPFGGVNGTLEALDMQVPVVTLVGKRHGERTSFSILSNLGVTATVAETGREFVDIAARLADDPAFMREVRTAIAGGLAQSPLTDMTAHTRHLEEAYRAALADRVPQAPAALIKS